MVASSKSFKMKYFILSCLKPLLALSVVFLVSSSVNAQYKSYKISVKGDTINIIDKNDLKQGRWVVHVDPLRGEPGYEEEGIFNDGEKDGQWRRYNLAGDFLAVENYRFGGKDGISQYFSPLGDLLKIENWRGYNPDAPYDTIPIYGPDNNQILSYKIVKAEQYSVKHGEWIYFDPSTGRIIKTEKYDRGRLLETPKTEVVIDEPMKKIKPKEVLEYEKKNKGKKKIRVRDGQTGN